MNRNTEEYKGKRENILTPFSFLSSNWFRRDVPKCHQYSCPAKIALLLYSTKRHLFLKAVASRDNPLRVDESATTKDFCQVYFRVVWIFLQEQKCNLEICLASLGKTNSFILSKRNLSKQCKQFVGGYLHLV